MAADRHERLARSLLPVIPIIDATIGNLQIETRNGDVNVGTLIERLQQASRIHVPIVVNEVVLDWFSLFFLVHRLLSCGAPLV